MVFARYFFFLIFGSYFLLPQQALSQSANDSKPLSIPVFESKNQTKFSLPKNTKTFILNLDSYVKFFTIDLSAYNWTIIRFNNDKIVSRYRFTTGNEIDFTQSQLDDGFCNCSHCSSGKRTLSKNDTYKILIEENQGDTVILGQVELVKKEIPAWASKKYKSGDYFEISNIIFYPNKAKFMKSSEEDLMNLLMLLQKQVNLKISIEGHVNAPKEKNNSQYQKLSENRAKNIMKFLIKHGISENRLSHVGFGNSKMLFEKPKNNEQIRANRRVQIAVK